jgi:hypothetical protein
MLASKFGHKAESVLSRLFTVTTRQLHVENKLKQTKNVMSLMRQRALFNYQRAMFSIVPKSESEKT